MKNDSFLLTCQCSRKTAKRPVLSDFSQCFHPDSIQPTIFPTIKWAVPAVVSPDHTETVVVVVWVLLTTPLRRLRINYVASLWKIEIQSISSHPTLPPFRVWFREECAPVMHQLESGLPRNVCPPSLFSG